MGVVGSDAVPILIAAFHDGSQDIRRTAASVLAEIPWGERAESALVAAFSDPAQEVRQSAAAALAKMRACTAAAVPALSAALRDSREDIRQSAVASLGTFKSVGAARVLRPADGERQRHRHRKDSLYSPRPPRLDERRDG